MSADVVWSRYNAMVVADTVLFGFLTQEHVPCLVKIWGSVTGIAVTVCWWLLTSYGWSLLHAEKAVTKNTKIGAASLYSENRKTRSGGVPTP